MTRTPVDETIRQNVEAALRDGTGKYGLPLDKMLDAVITAADVIANSRPRLARFLLQSALLVAPDRKFAARYALAQLPHVRKHLAGPPLAMLMSDLVEIRSAALTE